MTETLAKLNSYPVWTAIITPMNNDGSIDWDSFQWILQEQENARNAIFVLGSTGEGLALTLDEKKQVVDFVCKLGLKVPLMAGVGGFNLGETLSWIEFLNSRNLDAYSLVMPLYAKPMAHGQCEWFQSLLNASSKPCMIYNIPSRTGTHLRVEALSQLASHPQLWSIKESSGSIEDYKKYQAIMLNGRKTIHSGDDIMLAAFSQIGCQGVVSVASNLWPKATHLFAKLCLSGQQHLTQPLWHEASESIFVASNPIPTKVMMAHLGRIRTSMVRPPLSIQDMPSLDQLENINQQMMAWEKNQDVLKAAA